MKYIKIITILFISNIASAWDKGDIENRLKKIIENRSLEEVKKLYNFDDVDPILVDYELMTWLDSFEKVNEGYQLLKIEFKPLKKLSRKNLEYIQKGRSVEDRIYRLNMEIEFILSIQFKKANDVYYYLDIPCGKKDNNFYLAMTKLERGAKNKELREKK